MITLSLTILALILACLALQYSKPDSSRRLERYEPLMVGVQIICGDCSGDGMRPQRTFLDSSGNRCAQCGGTSYTLASTLAAISLQGRTAPSSMAPRSARVLSIGAALGKRRYRREGRHVTEL